MNKGVSRVIALLAAMALAGTLSGCGGEKTPPPEPTESAAAVEDETTEEVPDKGEGPASLDVGFFSIDVPEGIKYNIRNSHARGKPCLTASSWTGATRTRPNSKP